MELKDNYRTPAARSVGSPAIGYSTMVHEMNYNGADGLEFGAGNSKIDPTVLTELPQGCSVTSTKKHGMSFWAQTGRIDVLLGDGTRQSFFIKVMSKELGMNMIRVCLTTQICRSSVNTAPEKRIAHCWEAFFAKSMRQALDLEVERKGPSEELDALSRTLFEKVIPRLLRPLESDGRIVKPSLVHGDLCAASLPTANVSSPTKTIAVTRAESLEFKDEFGQWRPACNRFGDEYVAAYNTFTQISAPEEDFEGRLDLYRLRFDTHVSALFVDNETLRTQ
ncbi:hypothetical protein V498_04454 [Pseudogymnoascus sp. VKM F-4517 (FW-2822)]|nr:hypothetical protein V498_04454 [Pseudogymnoascus sp. VKM F-4517 (FW-2822)]